MLFFGNWRDLFSCNNRSETNPDSLPTMCGLSVGSQYEQDKYMLKVIRKTPDYQRVNLAGFEYFEPINLTNYQFLLLTLSEY